MELQKIILSQFVEIYEKPTFREISNMTGIQNTRVFRIFNGSPMKLYEFEVFQKLINKKQGIDDNFLNICQKAFKKLPPEALAKISNTMINQIRLFSLLSNEKEKRGVIA